MLCHFSTLHKVQPLNNSEHGSYIHLQFIAYKRSILFFGKNKNLLLFNSKIVTMTFT